MKYTLCEYREPAFAPDFACYEQAQLKLIPEDETRRPLYVCLAHLESGARVVLAHGFDSCRSEILPDAMGHLDIGVTGAEEGATSAQMDTFAWLLSMVLKVEERPSFELHHGDCIGADEQAHTFVMHEYPFFVTTYAHPCVQGMKTGRRAYCKANVIRPPIDALGRNLTIATRDVLIAMPPTYNEILRSGTWHTVRAAWKNLRPIYLIKPDGRLRVNFKSELVQHAIASDEARLLW